MKITGKDIAQLYIKEDTQNALNRATVLKEKKMSPFAQEFAQQMKQKGEGGVYRSKVTGYNVALKYAQPKVSKPAAPPQTSKTVSAPLPPVKPAAVTPSPAVKPGLTPGKQTLPTVNVKPAPMAAPKAEPLTRSIGSRPEPVPAAPTPTKQTLPNIDIKSAPKPSASVTTGYDKPAKTDVSSAPSIGFSKRTGNPTLARPVSLPASMTSMPTAKVDGKEVTQDALASQMLGGPRPGGIRGIRGREKGEIDTSKFYYPGKVSPEGRSTKVPTQSTPEAPSTPPVETPKPEAPKPQTSPEPTSDGAGARKMGIPIPTVSTKDASDDYMKGAERLKKDVGDRYVPPNINESVVTVGGNKYRIV